MSYQYLGRCITDRSWSILISKLGKEKAELAYAWYDELDISIRREISMPVKYMLENRDKWDK